VGILLAILLRSFVFISEIIIIIIINVPKSVETSQGGKVTIMWINKYKMTELSPTTNQT